MDDAVRETHGCKCHYPDAVYRSEVLVSEWEEEILLRLGSEKGKLTPWQARYLAAKLYRLSRRVRQRKGDA